MKYANKIPDTYHHQSTFSKKKQRELIINQVAKPLYNPVFLNWVVINYKFSIFLLKENFNKIKKHPNSGAYGNQPVETIHFTRKYSPLLECLITPERHEQKKYSTSTSFFRMVTVSTSYSIKISNKNNTF